MTVCCWWWNQKAIEVVEKKSSSDCVSVYQMVKVIEIEDDFGPFGGCCLLDSDDSGDPHPIHHHDLPDDP